MTDRFRDRRGWALADDIGLESARRFLDQGMYCFNCGAENTPGARFCNNCGTDLGDGGQPGNAPTPADRPTITDPNAPPQTPELANRHSKPVAREFITAPTGVKLWRLNPGDRIYNNRYTIVRELGRGGMGIVYLVKDHAIREKHFAIKVMAEDLAKDPNAAEDMKTEVLAAQGLHHPNIVAVYDFGDDGGAVFIKMEFVDGPSLRNLRQTHGRIPPDEVANWMRQACRGLAYAHEEGIIHMDIKPGNLLLAKSGRVKIADFGLALTLEASRTHRSLKGVFAGTAQYMSPEQYTGLRVSPRSDVYSLGATMYSLLTGRAPFRGRSVEYHIMHVMPEPLTDVPSWLNDLVLRCMAKNEYERPQTMLDLEHLLATRNGTMPAPEPTPHLAQSTDSLHVPGMTGAAKRTASGDMNSVQMPLAMPSDGSKPPIAAGSQHPPPAMSAHPALAPTLAPVNAAPILHGGNFKLIGAETFKCANDVEGEIKFNLPVYRFEPFAEAIRLAPGERAADAEFVLLPPTEHTGRFLMGSPAWEAKRCEDEWMHPVALRQPFLIARTVVTQRVYDGLRGAHGPYSWQTPTMPAASLSWLDAIEWCEALGLRLPSESEWEFGARAGTQTPFCHGSTLTTDLANYDGNYPYGDGPRGIFREQPLPVASFPANAFGLYEVHGNVCEWVADSYTKDYHNVPADGSPHDDADAPDRVIRSGSWDHLAQGCRSAVRNPYSPSRRSDLVGFRPAATP